MSKNEDEVVEHVPEYAGAAPVTVGSFTPVRFSHSPELGSIAPALVRAQRKLKNPSKDSVNPHFRNHFAGLGVTVEAAKDACNTEDIAVLAPPVPAPDGYIGISILLLHKSGEYIEGHGYIPLDRSNAQGAGSAITYARRYYLQSVLGMVGEDDDDGELASAAPATSSVVKRGLFRKN